MKTNAGDQREPASMWGPVALLLATGAAGLVLWQTHGEFLPLLPAAAFLALTGTAGVVWLYRVRAAGRFRAVLDAYAEEELSRAAGRLPTPSVKSSSTFSRSNR